MTVAAQQGAGAALLDSDVRRRLVQHLAALPDEPDGSGPSPRSRGLSAAELAGLVGLHVTTVRFHVDQLVRAGMLTAHFERAGGAGRPRKLYAVPDALLPRPADASGEHALAMLRDLVDASLSRDDGVSAGPEEQGRLWAHRHAQEIGLVREAERPATTPGTWLGKVGLVMDLMRGWGYQPEVHTSAGVDRVDVVLHDCPFRDLAREHPELVCAAHRGLMRGLLESMGEAPADVTLLPLVDPDTCHAHLTAPRPFVPPGGLS